MKNTLINLRIPSRRQLAFILILGFGAIAIFLSTRKKSTTPSSFSFDHLLHDTPIQLNIKTDLESLFKKNTTEKFQKAAGTITKNDSLIHMGELKIKQRGVTRKKICKTPPLMIKYGKAENKLKIKLVIPCQKGEDYKQLIYKEYLAYQMYHHLTDNSFRTQLVNVILEDKNQNSPPIKLSGFIIEDDDTLAKRVDSKVFSPLRKPKYLDQENYRLFALFQYCIGNTDWNLSKRHNIKLIRKKNSKTLIPVPYDFDYSGLVNAPYAIPHPQLPIKNVRERYFMWRGKNKKGFENVIALFQEKKESLFSLVNEFPHLEQSGKNEFLEYLESFYQKLETNDTPITS